MHAAFWIGICNLLTAMVVLLLSIPLWRGWIGPNRWYGVRTRASFASHSAWDRLNRLGGRLLALWSVPVAVTGLIGMCLLPPENTLLLMVLALAPGLYTIPALRLWRSQ